MTTWSYQIWRVTVKPFPGLVDQSVPVEPGVIFFGQFFKIINTFIFHKSENLKLIACPELQYSASSGKRGNLAQASFGLRASKNFLPSFQADLPSDLSCFPGVSFVDMAE